MSQGRPDQVKKKAGKDKISLSFFTLFFAVCWTRVYNEINTNLRMVAGAWCTGLVLPVDGGITGARTRTIISLSSHL